MRAMIAGALVVSVVVGACGGKGAVKPRTVAGPETPELARGVDGQIVRWTRPGRIEVVDAASGEATTVRELPRGVFVHAVSGPDATGRIAYIEDHFNAGPQRHMLRTVNRDGTDDVPVFERKGDAMWASTRDNGEIGTYIALAPKGGRVALLTGLVGRQMPGALFHEGRIEIWDCEKRKVRESVRALDMPMTWLPDGERLVFVAMAAPSDIPAGADALGSYGDAPWDTLPAIHMLDTRTGEATVLHAGWEAVVAPDGKTVYVAGWARPTDVRVWAVSLVTRVATPVRVPGLTFRAADSAPALLGVAGGLLVYRGVPTAGDTVTYTQHNSPLVGPKAMLTLKAVDPATGRFVTLMRDLDPRHPLSLGTE